MNSPTLTSLLLLATLAPLSSRNAGIDPALAKRYFQETQMASDDDGGALWGKKLYGPTLFFDPRTGDAVANQADGEQRLTPTDGVFAGKVPKDFAGANTALDWSGVHWTVLLWPLPSDDVDRMRLVLHESWHRIQSEIGLPSATVRNEHLATKDGRIWLLMEYRALSKALIASDSSRAATPTSDGASTKAPAPTSDGASTSASDSTNASNGKRALEDALAFRAYRRSLFPDAAQQEDRMEVHEGLAEYTGLARCGLNDKEARELLSKRLMLAAQKPALSYAFAYETGPAYGLMLDMQGNDWRKGLTPKSSLSSLLAASHKVDPGHPKLSDVTERAKAYDGDALIAAETKKDAETKATEAKFRRELVTGPVLRLPLVQKNYTFDPNAVVPLSGAGTVYLGCKFIDDWGILSVDKAALVDVAFETVCVAAPKSVAEMKGDGWSLELAAGWKLVPGSREGDITVVKE